MVVKWFSSNIIRHWTSSYRVSAREKKIFVGRSVGWSVGNAFIFSMRMVFTAPAQQITAPAQPPATRVTVYTALFGGYFANCGSFPIFEHRVDLKLSVNTFSGDKNGMLEYWSGPRNEYRFPKTAAWDCKTDTDLYELVKVIKRLVKGPLNVSVIFL